MAGNSKRKPKSSEATGNGVMALVKELWQAAVELRDSIEPADYKRYVLPLIFLRFLSIRYRRRRDELTQLVGEPKSDYYTPSEKAAKAILKDPDEYRAAGAFMVPERASWEYIRTRARADNIKVILDEALDLLERTYPKQLKGLLPPIYAGSNLDNESVAGLINLFSKEVFEQSHNGEDLIGRVYEYFIGEFANSEGKRGGEYFTPLSIVRTLVAMLEPQEGVVFDPCCGSGGMFVQSDIFTKHNRRLSFVGQESKEFTYRLCRMNLFIHGLDGNIQLGNSYFDEKHASVRAEYVLANPPFNDGAKGENGWGADRVADKDPRLAIDGRRVQLSPRNANTMWMLHFLAHTKDGGTAGFVMATGELSNGEAARLEVRKALVDGDHVDGIVQLSGQLFANTQVPCSLWFLSKSRHGGHGFRKRVGEILFIDGRGLGTLMPGSRKQKQLSDEEVGRIASVFRRFRREGVPEPIPGFCRMATIDEVRGHNYVLTPGRYVGAQEAEANDEPFEERFKSLMGKLDTQFSKAAILEREIRTRLTEIDRGV